MPDKIFEEKKKFINQVTKDLDRQVVGLSEQLLKVIIQEFVDKLDRNGDVIMNNSKNLKLIAAIDKVYQKFMGQVGGGIAKRIADGSSRIMGYNADYYSQYKKTEAAYKNSTASVEKIINDRLGIGDKVKLVEGGYMDSLLKDPTAKNAIKNLSYKEVIKGAGFKGFKKGLEKLIVGDEEKYGAFIQHYRNYAYDSFVQVDRDQTMLLAKDLDLQYFIYEGGLIDSSRPFCIKRAGEVFSLDESKDWVNDPWIQKNLDKGYITSYNPITDCGLFGCRHITRFISKEAAEMLRPDLKGKKPIASKPNENNPTNTDVKAAVIPAANKISGQFTDVEKSVKKEFEQAIASIDLVHGDGVLKDIPIIKKAINSTAAFATRKVDKEPAFIALNPNADKYGEFALIHEMGHFFDNYSLGKRNAFESENKDGLLKKVISVAEESESIKGIRELLKNGKYKVGDKEEVLSPEELQWVGYLVTPKEIWARAYTQFIAKRSGSKAAQLGVDEYFKTSDEYGIKPQWAEDDFKKIEEEIESMMLSEGWIKKTSPK